ncbi:MAG: TIGR04255 family protein [Thermosynechococcaceae cyanobacterium]
MRLAPVFYTLAQVQFNPIAQMSDYVARLQERLRRSGFPDFRVENQVGLTIRRLDDLQPDVQQQQQIRWSFTNAQRTEGYVLVSDTLTFHTTQYDSFVDFLQKSINGLSLVHEVVELAYIERIGLRYLDAIVSRDNDTLQQYLNLSLLGLSGTLEGQLGHSFTETATAIEEGNLVARAVITEGGLAVSPDLLPLQLELQSRFAEINGRNAVLDTDYFLVKRNGFDLEDIKGQLLSAHDIITTAFKASVTDYARAQWA